MRRHLRTSLWPCGRLSGCPVRDRSPYGQNQSRSRAACYARVAVRCLAVHATSERSICAATGVVDHPSARGLSAVFRPPPYLFRFGHPALDHLNEHCGLLRDSRTPGPSRLIAAGTAGAHALLRRLRNGHFRLDARNQRLMVSSNKSRTRMRINMRTLETGPLNMVWAVPYSCDTGMTRVAEVSLNVCDHLPASRILSPHKPAIGTGTRGAG
jgi:hypothetical protein